MTFDKLHVLGLATCGDQRIFMSSRSGLWVQAFVADGSALENALDEACDQHVPTLIAENLVLKNAFNEVTITAEGRRVAEEGGYDVFAALLMMKDSTP